MGTVAVLLPPDVLTDEEEQAASAAALSAAAPITPSVFGRSRPLRVGLSRGRSASASVARTGWRRLIRRCMAGPFISHGSARSAAELVGGHGAKGRSIGIRDRHLKCVYVVISRDRPIAGASTAWFKLCGQD
jgi:hypothetical protein